MEYRPPQPIPLPLPAMPGATMQTCAYCRRLKLSGAPCDGCGANESLKRKTYSRPSPTSPIMA